METQAKKIDIDQPFIGDNIDIEVPNQKLAADKYHYHEVPKIKDHYLKICRQKINHWNVIQN